MKEYLDRADGLWQEIHTYPPLGHRFIHSRVQAKQILVSQITSQEMSSPGGKMSQFDPFPNQTMKISWYPKV